MFANCKYARCRVAWTTPRTVEVQGRLWRVAIGEGDEVTALRDLARPRVAPYVEA